MTSRKKTENSGSLVGGNVNVHGGDFVAGDKKIKVGPGGVYAGRDIHDSNVVTGDGNQVGNQEAVRAELFEELFRRIDQRPDTPAEDREDLKANVAEIRTEVEKGEQADESFLKMRLRNIKRIAPDIAEVVLATLVNPAAGFALVVGKIAKRAQETADPQ
jgi:hypothetical protein